MTASKPAPSSPAGPGPKPTAPTGPTPTHPPKVGAFTENPPGPPPPLPPPPPAPKRGNGHVISDPRGIDPAQAARKACAAAGVGPIQLAQLVSDLRVAVAAAHAMTRAQWDPRTGPQQCDPWAESDVDIELSGVGADMQSALQRLDHLRTLTRPAPGPATVPSVAARESDGVGAVVAGASSDPGRRLSQRAPDGNGVTPGVGLNLRSDAAVPGRGPVSAPAGTGLHGPDVVQGVAPMGASFVLPKPKPWQWPGTTRLARDTYNATRTTGPAWPTG